MPCHRSGVSEVDYNAYLCAKYKYILKTRNLIDMWNVPLRS